MFLFTLKKKGGGDGGSGLVRVKKWAIPRSESGIIFANRGVLGCDALIYVHHFGVPLLVFRGLLRAEGYGVPHSVCVWACLRKGF